MIIPDAVGIDIIVAPFVRDACCVELFFVSDVTEDGTDSVSSETDAISNIC